MAVETKRICNGTFGELWLDGDYVGECYKAQAKVEFTKEEIKQCGTFFTDNKVVGCKGTGSLTMHKVNSRMAIKVANMVRNKQDVRFTLISKLADPDAYGAERVSITGVRKSRYYALYYRILFSGFQVLQLHTCSVRFLPASACPFLLLQALSVVLSC